MVTDQKTDVGTYEVTVTSKITVPTDFTLAKTNELSASVQFTLIVEDPCEETEILPFTIPNIMAYSQGKVIAKQLPHV